MFMRLAGLLISMTMVTMVGSAMASDSKFDDAVEAWLRGDDETALPRLAELARDGHSEARILLARIEVTDRGHSRFRRGLSAAEARKLFRRVDEDGIAPRSWLAVEAAQGNELAQALYSSRFPEANLDLIETLADLGEYQATDYLARTIALNGTTKERKVLLQSDALLDELRPFLMFLKSSPEPSADGVQALRYITGLGLDITPDDPDTRQMASWLSFGFGYGAVGKDNRWYEPVTDWIMSADATRPIADLCSAECGAETRECGFAFSGLLGGYFEMIRLDSPLETVIAQDRFLSSPRARLMALRGAAFARAETAGLLASPGQIAQISQCAADLVAGERCARN